MDFSGKVVIVTGSGQGIGLCTALEFIKKKASVIIVEQDQEAGEETRLEIENLGGDCLYVQTNVSDEESVKQMVNAVIERYGKIDILVNNAGIFTQEQTTLFTRSVEDFEHVMKVNVTSAYMCVKYCTPYMPEGSSIINIASTRAFMSEPHTEPYSASKGALLALTRALANSLAHKVRVNAISPGWIDVSGWKKKTERKFISLTERAHMQHLTGRVGKPEDIAKAILYLASEDASFITGANFVIDGGMTVKMIYEE